ncbi:hypothetical protein DL96DRAFT_1720891 [Flagelloscypha sp. PMI_526]|nr:hypothetical protein DL96DRAFT_1720891 [Flagelloscypha sp. PMI_526]
MPAPNPTRPRSTRARRAAPTPEQATLPLTHPNHRVEDAQGTLPNLSDSNVSEVPELAWRANPGPYVPAGERPTFTAVWPDINPRALAEEGEFSPSYFAGELRQEFETALSFEANDPPISQCIQRLIDIVQDLDSDVCDLVEPPGTFILLFAMLLTTGEYNVYGAELKKPSMDMPYKLHEVLSSASQDLMTDIGFAITSLQYNETYTNYRIGTSETFFNLRSDEIQRRGTCNFVELTGNPADIAGPMPPVEHLLSLANHDWALNRLLHQRNYGENKDTVLVYFYHKDLFLPPRDPSLLQSFQPHVTFLDPPHHAGSSVDTDPSFDDSNDAPAINYIRRFYAPSLLEIRRISEADHTGPYMACQIITRVVAISELLGMSRTAKHLFREVSILDDNGLINVKFADIEAATGISPLSRLGAYRTFYNKVLQWQTDLKIKPSCSQTPYIRMLSDAMELMLDRRNDQHVSAPSGSKYSVRGLATNTSLNDWKGAGGYFTQFEEYLNRSGLEGTENFTI